MDCDNMFSSLIFGKNAPIDCNNLEDKAEELSKILLPWFSDDPSSGDKFYCGHRKTDYPVLQAWSMTDNSITVDKLKWFLDRINFDKVLIKHNIFMFIDTSSIILLNPLIIIPSKNGIMTLTA